MNPKTRSEIFHELFPKQPAFRWRQITKAFFQPNIKTWSEVTTLPESMRTQLKDIPWMSVKESILQASEDGETYKALLEVDGGHKIETVLMSNHRGHWTICVSAQVGCAMGCAFCATGKMGLTRSLTTDEIIDQYRYWTQFLNKRQELPQLISNIAYMGMGEPLANYENIKESLNLILDNTEIGHTRIVVSTVGILPRLEQILEDSEWPHVRMAISLHSADPMTRKEIVPTSYDDFLPKLTDWSIRYLEKFGNRRHHLTFEYVMLKGVNDTLHHAKELAKMIHKIGNVRVNLIPYNFTGGEFTVSDNEDLQEFFYYLDDSGITVTRRRSMGDDIEAACGQLNSDDKNGTCRGGACKITIT